MIWGDHDDLPKGSLIVACHAGADAGARPERADRSAIFIIAS